MRVLLIFVLAFFLHASNLEDLIKNVPKNTSEYALDMAIIEKIKTLKPEPLQIDLNLTNEKQYIEAFVNLAEIIQKYNSLPSKIDEINKKIELLSEQNNTTAKLQKIYYQKLSEIYSKELDALKKEIPSYKEALYSRLKQVEFDVKKAQQNIQDLKKRLEEKKTELEKLKIDLQRWELLNNKDEIKKVKSLIGSKEEEIKKINEELLKEYLILWLNDIKYKDKKALEVDNQVLNAAKEIDPGFYKAISEVVNDFESRAFGSKLIVYNSKKELQLTLNKLWKILNYPLFTVGNRTITPVNFFIFVIILVLGWFIGKYYKKFIYSIRHRYEISHATATLLANMGYYTIITLSFLIALKVIGLDLSSLAIIAGALSVGIGFGLQNVVSNFVSGIILMFERSIKVGDYIQIDQDTRGEVVDISMRSTIIRTNDNINLIIPNQSFIQNNVINWTLGDDIVRFRVPFGVAYGSDVDKVERVILDALKNSNVHYIKKHPTLDVTPRVTFIEMGDSSLNFELMVWVKGKYARMPRRTRSEFLKMIYKALNKAGIEIPFPQQDLHIKDSVPFEIKIKKD